MESVCETSCTAKLWMNYMQHVALIRNFLRAERTGDSDFHLYTDRKMIPSFHASGHFAYAKSARLCLQDMENIRQNMSEQFHQLTVDGFFTVRRKYCFWSGNFSD